MTDLTGLNALESTRNQTLEAIKARLITGVNVLPYPRNFTVAALPATGSSGEWAYATNGRKPAEGPGAGTGVPVWFNSGTATWFSYCSGTVVLA